MLGAIRKMEGGTPPITAGWVVILVASIALFHYHPEYKKDLALHWSRVIKHREYYRCVTSFLCFGGKFGTGKLIELFLISQSASRLESESPIRFALTLILCCLALLYLDYKKILFWTRVPWLSNGLTLALISSSAWTNPFRLTTLAPLPLPPFPSWLLPPILCAQSILLFGASWKTMLGPVVVSIPCHIVCTLLQDAFPVIGQKFGGGGQESADARLQQMFGGGGVGGRVPSRGPKATVEILEDDEDEGGAVLVEKDVKQD